MIKINRSSASWIFIIASADYIKDMAETYKIMTMKGDFVLENNISRPTADANLENVHKNSAEPYVGMPIYLDDSFFKFVSEDVELDCDIDDDMSMGNGGMKPPNSGNGGMMPPNMGGGGNKPDMDTGKPMDCVKGCPLAMAYVPWQAWEETYELEKGFMVGTIFPCLDLPFLGGTMK